MSGKTEHDSFFFSHCVPATKIRFLNYYMENKREKRMRCQKYRILMALKDHIFGSVKPATKIRYFWRINLISSEAPKQHVYHPHKPHNSKAHILVYKTMWKLPDILIFRSTNSHYVLISKPLKRCSSGILPHFVSINSITNLIFDE